LPNFTRHQIAYNLLSALRGAGLGVRDEFEGRQEPTSWFFRCLAYDQSELDIMESGHGVRRHRRPARPVGARRGIA
jgi:hypothetical protein